MNQPFQSHIEQFIERHHYKRVVPRAALIDMDGTLFDSMGYHADAWHQMMTERGVNSCRDEFFLHEGRTAASTCNEIFRRELGREATAGEVVEMYNRKKEIFNSMPSPRVMPGAREVLEFFVKTGLRCVLVTGSGQNSLLSRLDREFPGVFSPSLMVTGQDVTHGKPHPEPYIRGMQIAGVRPSETIVLENAPLGVKSGDSAGAFTIGVSTGPMPGQTLADAGAAVTFTSMEECARQIPYLLLSLVL